MRIAAARAAAPLLALLASFMALPAQALETDVTLTLSQRWENVASLGSWAPYTATIKDDGTRDFTGDLLFIPNENLQRGQSGTYPDYRLRVNVQKGSEKAFTVYVIQAPSNYRAELRDLGGHTVAAAEITGTHAGGHTLAVLSDQHQVDQRIAGYRPLSTNQLSVSRFASAAAFPNNAVYLSGLNGILIDDFDTASLSQAQVQALKDFVGLGGSLVVAGGPSWRRTMVPLPAELSPLRPSASATVSMQPLADLDATITKQSAQIAVGEVKGKVLLGPPDGFPLVVGTRYGAGQVIDLAYDPLAEPFLSADSALGTVGFSQALSRALLEQSAAGHGFGPGPTAGPIKVAPVASAPGGGMTNAMGPAMPPSGDQIFSILLDTPVAALPPLALLGGLLLGYVLLVGPFNYLLMRALGRRELLWASVPAVSLVFTMSAYAIGFGSRGSDFVDNEVQIQRLAPEGAVQTQTFYGIYSPRKGDYSVRFPANTLVSTALAIGPYGGLQGEPAMIDVSGKPMLQIQAAAVWSMRAAQSLSLTHQPVAIEAHLGRSGSHLVGSLANRGQRPLGTLWAVTGVGEQAEIASSLAAGQTIQVDQELSSASGTVKPMQPGGSISVPGGAAGANAQSTTWQDGSLTPEAKRAAVLRIAAGSAVSGDPYEISLVGLTDPTSTIQVSGGHLTRYTIAAVVIPVRLDTVDAVGNTSPLARLVSTVQARPNEFVDAYDLAFPAGVKGRLDLLYTLTTTKGMGGVRAVEVYDWSAGTWRALPDPVLRAPVLQGTARDTLRPGELQNGLVRVRVHEFNAGLAGSLLKLQEPATSPTESPPR
jgi:hypothetical protein